MISARDLLATGFCDAVITGGVDTLCDLTLNGFEALAALSRSRCLPMSRNRTGLNIGEGAALMIMTREDGPVRLIGGGESGDAHHMTAPHPEGLGAERAMREALRDARLEPADIAYLNLHGTATPQNDAMEAKAVARIFDAVPTSSTKPLVGHCLGAAGAIEAAFCWLALQADENRVPLPPHIFDGEIDVEIPVPRLVSVGETVLREGPTRMMSNSFAFGGNNCALILEGGTR
jgi:3-oxoacyl-[acyl-carrier-protein] synthase-1